MTMYPFTTSINNQLHQIGLALLKTATKFSRKNSASAMKSPGTVSSFVMNASYTVVFLLLTAVQVKASAPDSVDYFSTNDLRYEDRVYVKNIKTAQLSSNENVLVPPIIQLNAEDTLFLTFDDLDGDRKNYSYSIVHCTASWEPSNILTSEYLDGFVQNPITDYHFSRGTIQQYTHYSLMFPNDDVKLLKSGNYLLKVFTDNDEDKIVLTKRFMVYEEKVTVEPFVHSATTVADTRYKQEVDFTLNYNPAEIANPYAEIKPVILQNYRWDNAITGLQPQFLKDQQLVYDYDDVNVFSGGNEFRWFDTHNLRLNSEHVDHIWKDSTNTYHVQLLPDERRSYKSYVTNSDIDGSYLVRTTEGTGGPTDAEYCWVHFFLPWAPPLTDGNLYLFGAFCDWQCRPDCRMTYNYGKRGYEASIYLKQGYYNYEYVFLKDNAKSADDVLVEGMHQETENSYLILVYYRRQGALTDELVGLKQTSSRR
jgi:hypothetical protein